MKPAKGLLYVQRNFDEAAILAVAAKVAWDANPHFDDSELATLAAMQRAHPSAGNTPQELGEWLQEMDDKQIMGVVSNTKGVLHEMEFVRIENTDGDSIYAAMFEQSNYPGYDVRMVDESTGAIWDVQLKATDNTSYVQDWIDNHPDGEIIVTQELADKMDLSSSGMTNEALTVRTEELVDKLVGAADNDSMWDYFPGLTVASIGIVIVSLWRRYRKGEISLERFKQLAARTTGLKAGKIALLSTAMMIPGLNVAVGALLVSKLILSGFAIGNKFNLNTPLKALLGSPTAQHST
ncbi:MAG: hypothetical protein M0R76_00480 [Proteobacteria bacterium]|nr:hypothetical protein [Pseudomonadota bacterium]